MLHDDLIGNTFEPNNGEGITLQELLELIRTIPAKARQNYVRVVFGCEAAEVTGLAFAQHDQAEKWDFNVYIKTDYKEESPTTPPPSAPEDRDEMLDRLHDAVSMMEDDSMRRLLDAAEQMVSPRTI